MGVLGFENSKNAVPGQSMLIVIVPPKLAGLNVFSSKVYTAAHVQVLPHVRNVAVIAMAAMLTALVV